MMLFLLWSNGIVDLKTTFWKNSWLKVAVAIAAIVALELTLIIKIYLFPVLKIYSTIDMKSFTFILK
jgi:hypothetical protein